MAYLRLSGSVPLPTPSTEDIAPMAMDIAKAHAIKGGSYGPGGVSLQKDVGVAQIISLVGNLGIMAWQFMRGKKRAKRRSKRLKLEEATKNEVTNVLNKIYNTGMELVSEGYNPTTAKFEQKMYDLLFQKIGYKGNCNAIVWVPKTKPGKDRPVWFRIENNGRTLTPVTMTGAPPNLQSYWYSRCQGAKTDWMREYQTLLISISRGEILQKQESQQKKGSLMVGVGITGIAVILGLVMTFLAMQEISGSE